LPSWFSFKRWVVLLSSFFHGPIALRPLHFRGFAITLRHTTLGRTLLDEGSARRENLHLTHNTHSREASVPPVGFEPAIPTRERQPYTARPLGSAFSQFTLRFARPAHLTSQINHQNIMTRGLHITKILTVLVLEDLVTFWL
jgi:hypothetical protein